MELSKVKVSSSLTKERGQTDESLTTERGKTDDSLLNLRGKTEDATDKKLKSDRDGADKLRAQTRLETDANTNLNRATDIHTASKDKLLDEEAADSRLYEQRRIDDAAVESERLLADGQTHDITAKNTSIE